MVTPDLAILIHRALEPRLARLLDLTLMPQWQQEPETLHQVRLACRRLRTALDLVEPACYPGFRRHERCLRKLTEALGSTRELDVHLSILEDLKRRDSNPVQEVVLEHLQEQVDRKRRRQHRSMDRILDDLDLKSLMALREHAKLPQPMGFPLQMGELWGRLEVFAHPVEEVLPPLLEQEDALALHAFRIHVKRLRYALEILESAFPVSMQPWLLRMKSFQTALGEHHDLALLEGFLWDTHEQLVQRGRSMLARGVLDIIGIVAEERRNRYEQFRSIGQELSQQGIVITLKSMLEASGGGIA